MNSPKSKPKIALACPSFSGGGAERVMVTLANKFSDYGYPVDFLVGVDKGPYKYMLDKDINKIVLTNQHSGRLKKLVCALFKLRQYKNSTSADVLMSTVREFNVFIFFALSFSNRKIKVFLREAAALDESHFNGSLRGKLLLCLMRYSYKRASKVISNSDATRQGIVEYLGLSKEDVFSIYNPLDIDENPGRVIKKSKKKVVISVGRLVKNKNFHDLIRAIPLVKEQHGEIILKILGEGEDEKELRRLARTLNIENSVQFVGFVDNPYDYYREADVFAQTSLWEGFGYVLAEAMACGTPVVAYDSKGAMREILADGKYGKLTPVGDLQALADAIILQIEDPTPLELLEEAVERFDVEVIAKQYLEALGVNHD